MKRTDAMTTLVLIALMLVGIDAGFCLQIIKQPYLQNVTQTSITIMWETDKDATAQLRYAQLHQSFPEGTISNGTPHTIHEIRLENLRPQTEYQYQVISQASADEIAESDVLSFRTAPYHTTPFRFVVWGDNRTDYRTCEQVCQLIALQNPDIVLNVGDVVTNGYVYSQWDREYFHPIRHFSDSVPSYIAIGNHERNAPWFDRFVSQPGNEHWFAFSYGNSRFLILDTNLMYRPGSEQYEWLVKELASEESRGAAFRFAFFHHPPYSEQWDSPGYTGEAGVRTSLVPVLEESGVDIVFSGHTHDYERGTRLLATGGEITYVISGGGGSALDRVETRDWDVIELHRSVYHCVVVDVAGAELTYRAVGLDGGEVDAFTRWSLSWMPTHIEPFGKLPTTWSQIKGMP